MGSEEDAEALAAVDVMLEVSMLEEDAITLDEEGISLVEDTVVLAEDDASEADTA